MSNPLEPGEPLKPIHSGSLEAQVHPQSELLPYDSAITRAEKEVRYAVGAQSDARSESMVRNGDPKEAPAAPTDHLPSGRQKGVAPIKSELVSISRMYGRRAHISSDT